jgi:hypothetical protein
MKALVLSAALSAAVFFGTISAAGASWHYDTTYRDLLRPNGQPRGNAAYQADLDFCGRQTHVTDKFAPDRPAFKQCMLSRNWRWVSTKVVQDPPAASQRRGETYGGLKPVRVYPEPHLMNGRRRFHEARRLSSGFPRHFTQLLHPILTTTRSGSCTHAGPFNDGADAIANGAI